MLGLVEGDLEKQDELGIAVAKYMRALEYYNESTAKVIIVVRGLSWLSVTRRSRATWAAVGSASILMCSIGASEEEVVDITGPYHIDYVATAYLVGLAVSSTSPWCRTRTCPCRTSMP